MNREQIMAMKPGRELNYLVAEKVMGWKYHDSMIPCIYPPGLLPYQNIYGHEVPNYSTDIGAAWEVVEKFDFLYLYRWNNQPCKFECDPGEWECKLSEKGTDGFLGIGKTAPEAICKASLLAVLGGE